MNIFLDFDGTLIDSRQRLYQLFQRLVPCSTFNFDEYWELKRNGISHQLILNNHFPNKDYDLFMVHWMKLIETKEYLDLDIPIQGVSSYLANLRARGDDVYLVTSRQFVSGVVYQLEKFEWLDFFNELLVTQQKYDKRALVKPFLKKDVKGCLIGDTGEDIKTAKDLGLFSVGVCSGFLSKEVLETYKPDLLISDVTKFNPRV